MRQLLGLGLMAATLTFAGCMSGVRGTWTGDGVMEGPIAFSTMTMAGDGTFTAEGTNTAGSKVVTGHYHFDGQTLVFEANGKTQMYHAIVQGDTLVVSDQGKTIMMKRMPKRDVGADQTTTSQMTHVDSDSK